MATIALLISRAVKLTVSMMHVVGYISNFQYLMTFRKVLMTLFTRIFSAGEDECNADIFMTIAIVLAVIAFISIVINIVQCIYSLRASTSTGEPLKY